MAKLEIIKKALENLQEAMIKMEPPLLVAEDDTEVIGIVTMFPGLKSFVVSKDQYKRSGFEKTWKGEVIFLDGKTNEKTTKTYHEKFDSVRKGSREELSISSQGTKKSSGQIFKSSSRQDTGYLQKEPNISKTSKK